ncbi:MAG: hypothetical protein QG585_643 [Patescibacteria group bacterium]|jgi:hypothetical protein|nr:hypothetical protein [Patescibacteria group bacterium]
MKLKIFFFLTLIAIFVLGFLIIFNTKNTVEDTSHNVLESIPKVLNSNETLNDITASVSWKDYNNTAYNYQIKYPESIEINTTDEYSKDGYVDSTGIAFHTVLGDIIIIQAGGATTTNLLNYANYFRNQQVNNDRLETSTKNSRIVGELSKTEFNGRPAYQMLLSSVVRFEGWGSVIGDDDEPFVYIITENSQGEKFVIAYREEFDLSKKILETFRYTK